MNKAGAFVSPYAAVFPFTKDELPNSISSPDWNKLDLNITGTPPDPPDSPQQAKGPKAVPKASSSTFIFF